jgi:prolipoprotein diacylglyceryl transferase
VPTVLTSWFLANIPSPDRGVWHVGPFPIRAYALCIIAGIVVAVVWGERRLVARGGQPGTVTDVAVFAVPFGLVGGRLYHIATDYETYFGPGGHPIDALKIWQGGLGIWGAVALGGVGAWIGCRRRGVPLPFFADAVAPAIVVAQAIGRLGNYFNQELYGGPTTLPWGLEIYARVVPGTSIPDPLGGVARDAIPVAVVHPTFLYELIWNLLVAGLVVWADRRFRLGHGRAFAVYVAGYTLGRFFIEQMRSDPATRVFGDIRINTVVAAVVFLGAVAYLVLVRKPREDLAALAAASGPTPAPTATPVATNAGETAAKAPSEPAGATDAAPSDKPIDKPIDKPADKAAGTPIGKPADSPAGKAANASAAAAAGDPAPVPAGAATESSSTELAADPAWSKPESGQS